MPCERRAHDRALDTAARPLALASLFGAALALAACSDDPVEVPLEDGAPRRLSETYLFRQPLAALQPADDVYPYEVAASLWADHAGKQRFVAMRGGGTIDASIPDAWTFPEGTIIVKDFGYPVDPETPQGPYQHVETRLLVREDGDWKAHTYLWNADQTDAERLVEGVRLPVPVLDEEGQRVNHEYVVPNVNQCRQCHGRGRENHLLGLITAELNRDVTRDGRVVNQLAWLDEAGLFAAPLPPATDLPALPDPFGDAPVDARARAYLQANCAHCHRPDGAAGSTGLFLLADETNPTHFGVCKPSVAAGGGTGGREFDVLPGAPDESILLYRMGAAEPEIRMPELVSRIPDRAGMALVADWIEALAEDFPEGCE